MADELSTQITEPQQVEGDSTAVVQAPNAEESNHKALSRDDAIEKAMAELGEDTGEEDAPEPKPEKAEKAEKPAKEEEPEDDDKPDNEVEDDEDSDGDDEPEEKAEKQEKRPAKSKSGLEAPQHYLPAAKEKWVNVPHEVRSEIYRTMKEAENLTAELRQQTERYESIREFDELARSNGRDLRDSLLRVQHIENLLGSNPLAGLNAILLEAGPRKPDGQPVSLFEIADAVVRMGQDKYQQMISQRPAQQQAPANSEVQDLRARLAAMEAQQRVAPVIAEFRASHDRYDELAPAIAKLMQSGMVPDSLSPSERLSAAYDMAVRLNPPSHVEPEADDGLAPERRAANNFGGSSKSIRGAPPSGAGRSQQRRKMSKDDAIEAAMSAILS